MAKIHRVIRAFLDQKVDHGQVGTKESKVKKQTNRELELQRFADGSGDKGFCFNSEDVKTFYRTQQHKARRGTINTRIVDAYDFDEYDRSFVDVYFDVLSESALHRNPLGFGLMGPLLTVALAFGVTAGTMAIFGMVTGTAALPAVLSALPFLAFLGPLAPVFGMLAFAALVAAAALVVYALVVVPTVHYATRPDMSGFKPVRERVKGNNDGCVSSSPYSYNSLQSGGREGSPTQSARYGYRVGRGDSAYNPSSSPSPQERLYRR